MWVLPLWHKCAWLVLLMLAIVTYVTNNDWSKRKLQNMNVSYVCKQFITNTYNSLTSQAQFFLSGNLDVVCHYIYQTFCKKLHIWMWVVYVTNLMYPNFVTYVMNKLSVTYTMRVFLANESLTYLVHWLPGVMYADDICYMHRKCYQNQLLQKVSELRMWQSQPFHMAAKKSQKKHMQKVT